MFTLGLREGLEASLIVALVLVAARGTRYTRLVVVAVAAAVMLSAAIVVVVRAADLELGESTRYAVKAGVALLAVVFLSSTVRWSIDWARSPVAPNDSVRLSGLASVAFLAVMREGLEVAIFPAAGVDDRWGPGTPSLVAGVAVATVIGAITYAGFRNARDRMARWTSVIITLIAAGLLTAAVRSVQRVAGWQHPAVVDLGWVGDPEGAWQSLLRGLLGWHGAPTALEIGAYVLYLGAMGVLMRKAWTQTTPRPGPRRPLQTIGAS